MLLTFLVKKKLCSEIEKSFHSQKKKSLKIIQQWLPTTAQGIKMTPYADKPYIGQSMSVFASLDMKLASKRK